MPEYRKRFAGNCSSPKELSPGGRRQLPDCMNTGGGGRGTAPVPREYPQEEKRQLPDCPNTGGGWRRTIPVPGDYPHEAGGSYST
jgi:hypothetical protein